MGAPGSVCAGLAVEEALPVEVVYAPAGRPVDLSQLVLPPGTTLAQALDACGVLKRHGLALEDTPVGIWGRRARPDTLLRPGDRVELYRPLVCDPKQARRLRQRGQRSPRAGTSAPATARSRPA